jgi:hypothetical protein
LAGLFGTAEEDDDFVPPPQKKIKKKKPEDKFQCKANKYLTLL